MAQKADMHHAAAELDRRSRYLRTLIHQRKTSDNPKAESLEGERGDEEGRATKEESLVVVKRQQQEEKRQRKKGHVGRGGEVDPGVNNQGNLRVRTADMPPELQKRAVWCADQEEPLVVLKQPEEEEKQQRKKGDVGHGGEVEPGEKNQGNLRVRAADMPLELQKRAFRCAHQMLAEMPKLDSKRLALTLKKEFDSSYGPAWHCIVGKSFGSYVTHSLGGFLYFSIDKVYILLFRTAVEPLEQ